MSSKLATNETIVNVGMGNIAVIDDTAIGRAVLGSCIGLALYCESRHLVALAHIVLPESVGQTSTPGKFADTAIPEMIRQLEAKGVTRSQLTAKMAGGASMFAASGNMEIGKSNFEKVSELLKQQKIPVEGHDIGGDKGRKIVFDPACGEMCVEQVGKEPVLI